MGKKKIGVIISIIALMFVAGISLYIYFGSNGGGNGVVVPAGFEIEESIDLSYDQWSVGPNYNWARVLELADGSFYVSDAMNSQIAQD